MNLDRWLGKAWLCPDCGRIIRRPPNRTGDDRYHAVRCMTPLVRIRITK